MNPRKVTIIGVPLDLGAGRRGVDMGPSALRVAEVDQRLRDLGHEVDDAGDVQVEIAETHAPGDPRLKYLKEIRATCEAVRDLVAATLERGRMPLLLGGDHSLAMGSIAGVARHFAARQQRIGVIWFDAHADANTADTSPSGNIHGMPLAVALGVGEASLTGLGGVPPMVAGACAAAIGLRDVDVAERANIERMGLRTYTMRAIDERGMRAVVHEAIQYASAGTAGIHVSFDLDAMDPGEAPGVGTPSPGGLSFREAHLAMEMLADTGLVLSAEFVEVNPIFDEQNRTARLSVGLMASLLGKTIL